MTLSIAPPKGFNLWRTIYSHGWCVLPPFSVQDNEPWLRRTELLSSGTIVTLRVTQPQNDSLSIDVESVRGGGKLTRGEKAEITRKIAACLRLDEDYSGFYREVRKLPEFHWVGKRGAGRLLRSPSVFEDAVKMICTTNCSWALTEIMVKNLCSRLGQDDGNGQQTFPTPQALASTTEAFLRKEIRAGYRAPYLLEFGRRVASGELNPELWRTSTLPAGELYDEVRSVKGIGPYAAGNLLKLLGRYDYLALDSWCRKKFRVMRGKKTVSDRTIERYYAKHGEWKGLFLWLDLTKDWYDKKFPI